MKKINLFFLLALAFNFSYGQNNSHGGNHDVNENSQNAKWNVYGNDLDDNDVFGSTNNKSVNFITNNISRMILGTDGVLQLKALAGTGNRILTTDANGNLVVLPGNISDGIMNWSSSGGNTSLMSGNLGLGTSSPSFKLDVVGDARISNNLYVGGGVVITNKVDASIEVKAGNLIVNNDMDVSGNSRVGGILTSQNGFMIDNSSGFRFSQGSTPGTGTFQLGKIQPFAVPCAAQPASAFNFGIGGMLQIYDPNNAINGGLLNLQTWTGGCSIDASVGGNIGFGGLLINYFCGNNTLINTGANGGTVFLGKTVVNGKISLSHPSAEFMVNGTIVSKEIYVTKVADWPDYVFKSDYKLLSLSELETFYTKEHHLPNVPGADEIDKTDINVAEISAALLRKIEELTLYTVEQNKQIETLKKEVELLKSGK